MDILRGRRRAQLPPATVAARCRDVARRRRDLLITTLIDDRIALTVPPGEVAILSAIEVDNLRDHLRTAAFNSAGALLDDERGLVPPPNLMRIEVPCADAASRRRTLTIVSAVDQPVTLLAPAGGIAVLWISQIGHLRYLLRQAQLRVADASSGDEVMQAASSVRDHNLMVAAV